MNEIKTTWRTLAEELGFEVDEGAQAIKQQILLGYGLRPGEEDQLPGMVKMAMGLLDMATAKLEAEHFIGVLKGEHSGQRFFLGPKSEGESGWVVRIRHPFPHPMGIGLLVYQERWTGKLGKLLGAQDVQLGNPALDSLVMVKAGDPARAQALLGEPDLQEELINLFSLSKGIVIYDWGLQYEERSETINRARAQQIMDAIVPVAALWPSQE